MNIKKFRAANLSAALSRVRNEIGSDAIIVETRQLPPSGWRGLAHRSLKAVGLRGLPNEIEVTVAWNVPAQPTRVMNNENAPTAEQMANDESESTMSFAEQIETARRPSRREDADPVEVDANWTEEFRFIRSMLAQTLDRIERPSWAQWEDRGGEAPYPDWLKPIYFRLKRQGVAELSIRSILDPLLEQGLNTEEAIEAEVTEALARLIGRCRPIQIRQPGKSVLLVGPTGAGKTTTIAKLAAHFTIEKRKRVGLITCDTYRMGAAAQLRGYGELLRIPVHVAHDISELKTLYEQLKEHDIILVDTAGRSHRDEMGMEELQRCVACLPKVEVHLVVPATLEQTQAAALFERYRSLKAKRLIISKLDEVESYGALINFPVLSGLPLSYMSTGQRVPEDFQTARNKNVARLALGLEVI